MMNSKMGVFCEIIPCRVEKGVPMIRLLICDDDIIFLNKLRAFVQSLFDEMGAKVKIHAYCSWEEIGTPILSSYDIAILDLDFSQKKYTGIDIAKKLRVARKDAIIIFLSNYIEYAPDGYEVQAFRYILKSDLHKKLEPSIRRALDCLRSSKETMKIQINGELIDLRLSNILYFEAQQHTVIAYVQKESDSSIIKQYRFYSTLTTLERQLTPHGFLRIQKSYLANMEKLKRYQCSEAVLINGTVLPVSAKNYAEQKEKYLLWKGR